MNTKEEPMMSGALTGWENSYRFDDDAWEDKHPCDIRLGWEGLESRLIELGLS
jgi:hypothetical protein